MSFQSKSRVTKAFPIIIGLMLITTFSIVFPGCENEEFENVDHTKDLERVNDYIYLENNQYSFSLSLSEGMNHGLTEEEYYDIVLSVDEVNNAIREAEKEGNVTLVLADPHSQTSDTRSMVRLKSGGIESDDTIFYGSIAMHQNVSSGSLSFTATKSKIKLKAAGTSAVWSVTVTSNKGHNIIMSGTMFTNAEHTITNSLSPSSYTIQAQKQQGSAASVTVRFEGSDN